MWIQRDFFSFLRSLEEKKATLPVKILKGPRQVGKTSLLSHLDRYQLVLFDDLGTRRLARENPSFFLDQFKGPVILDEATLAPEIFPELKKRVDEQRRTHLKTGAPVTLDIWVTGSNQTLLQKSVQESLAGRASYFGLNTLSIHELESRYSLENSFMRGGWPELYVNSDLSHVQYLNDFISTFIEKDIVSAAGIEKKAAFNRVLQLSSGRLGQLLNFSDIAKTVGADITTIQSWISLLEQNGVVRLVLPYFTNMNQRLIKAPKLYFEDVGLATRLQGWSDFQPLLVSPYLGSLVENLAYSEISRFFYNRGTNSEIHFVRSKEKVEVDFLVQLPNQRFVAIEVKTTPVDFDLKQLRLLESLGLNILERWVVSPQQTSYAFPNASVVNIADLDANLQRVWSST